MASISSAGIGSGLDVESIVTKLMVVEKQPVTELQTKASTIQTKISAFGLLAVVEVLQLSRRSPGLDQGHHLGRDRGHIGRQRLGGRDPQHQRHSRQLRGERAGPGLDAIGGQPGLCFQQRRRGGRRPDHQRRRLGCGPAGLRGPRHHQRDEHPDQRNRHAVRCARQDQRRRRGRHGLHRHRLVGRTPGALVCGDRRQQRLQHHRHWWRGRLQLRHDRWLGADDAHPDRDRRPGHHQWPGHHLRQQHAGATWCRA